MISNSPPFSNKRVIFHEIIRTRKNSNYKDLLGLAYRFTSFTKDFLFKTGTKGICKRGGQEVMIHLIAAPVNWPQVISYAVLLCIPGVSICHQSVAFFYTKATADVLKQMWVHN